MLKRFQDWELLDLIRIVQPGTGLREGLENIRRAKTGALIVVSGNHELDRIVHGGFKMDTDFSPYSLYELAKMDGALILSPDLRRVLYANVELNPNSFIPTLETGIRHRTAERVAKQTECIVISVSQRRDMITIYKGNRKYVLKDVGALLASANQGLQTLEKYANHLNAELEELSILEIEDATTVMDLCRIVQRFEMVFRMAAEIEGTTIELGTEGRLITMQMEELMVRLYRDVNLLFLDYMGCGVDAQGATFEALAALEMDALLEVERVARILGFDPGTVSLDTRLHAKGHRLLSQIPRLPHGVIRKLVQHFNGFQSILKASSEELLQVDGIGEIRAEAVVTGLQRIKEKILQQL